jgi:RNA ligase (TIGR02306 family)
MSSFGIYLKTIEKIYPHNNADKLELAKLVGNDYQFVIPKGRYKVGDNVLYFPIDSVLPPKVQETLGLQSKRIKTVKLRGEISQGVVASLPELVDLLDWTVDDDLEHGIFDVDFAPSLGVTKYEPPQQVVKFAHLVTLPEFSYVYDLENAENFPDEVDRLKLLGTPIIVTEKLEGSHFSCSYYPKDNNFIVCQRRHEIRPDESSEGTHTWIRLAQELELQKKCELIYEWFLLNTGANMVNDIQCVTLRGEVVGHNIACGADNIYKLNNQQLYFFELEINGEPIDASLTFGLFGLVKLPHVPILGNYQNLGQFLEQHDYSLNKASYGYSQLNPFSLREGIVIKPIKELYSNILPKNRLVLKQRNREYLAETKQ